VRALRALLDEPAFTRSQAERMLVALLRTAGLPQPRFNARVEGYEVDALWPRERVVLEFDSYAFHATRAAFERDRRRTAALTRRRYVVLRTTWRELTQASHALIARTAEALALSAGAPTGLPARAVP
jgi:very-short-patch-repair endonuclease